MNPKYDEYIKPLLVLLKDNNLYKKSDIYDSMAILFSLSDEDLSEVIPSGNEKTYTNRIGWALTYLKKALLVESPSRAIFRITKRGLSLLKENPTEINKEYLSRYEEFNVFQTKTRFVVKNNNHNKESNDETSPEESIGKYHQELKRILISDLLDEIRGMSPMFFEKLVLDLLEKMGYGKAEGTTYTNDHGIDGIIKSDKLGLDKIYVQAKRYAETTTVGSPDLNAFVGALIGKRGLKGVFITTSSFTRPAIEYAESISERVILIDGVELGRLMFEYNVGLQISNSYTVKKIDRDYFDE